MRILTALSALWFSACSAEIFPPPAPVARSIAADIDGDGFPDTVDLNLNDPGWRLTLTFGGRPHDVRTIDRGPVASRAPWQLNIEHGGEYQPSPRKDVQAQRIRATDDVIIFRRHDKRRMLVWNSPDTGIELVAID
ncbi:MAG: hypothetical protein EON61_11045 [Alphaproteobacteria bacterium]|jgi:hypothetical protein|nr:MAG: hypothetical protein EON61_11045 [Alphaproteobacteria bacterium]